MTVICVLITFIILYYIYSSFSLSMNTNSKAIDDILRKLYFLEKKPCCIIERVTIDSLHGFFIKILASRYTLMSIELERTFILV